MGNNNHVVVSHKLCGLQGRVGGRVVVMKEQCSACSNFLLRSPGKLHNWSQRCLRAHGLFGDSLHWWVLKFFQHFLSFCWCFGRPERSSSSADTQPALKHKCHSKTAVQLKEGFRQQFYQASRKTARRHIAQFCHPSEIKRNMKSKSTLVKTVCVHSAVSRGRLMQ
jgi:hypothetical protein